MKVTALMDDQLVTDVKKFSGKKTITDALTFALSEWLNLQKIKKLNAQIERNPIQFQPGFSAESVRALSRRKRS